MCGHPGSLSITARELPIDTLVRGDETTPLAPDAPLDFAVEREGGDGASAIWKSEALEYGFAARGDGTELVAPEYAGRNLDWYHFDLKKRAPPRTPPASSETRMVPTALHFRGAPHPRWWRFEDGDAYFDSPHDPEPNVLSMLLPEFAFVYVNNWYLAPLPQTDGTIREITRLTVFDCFGVASDLCSSIWSGASDWVLYSLSALDASALRASGGAFLFVPNVFSDVLSYYKVQGGACSPPTKKVTLGLGGS